MDYEEAKKIVENFFNGVAQPVRLVAKALDVITEEDYNEIQNVCYSREQLKAKLNNLY